MLDYASTRIEQGNKSEHKLYEFINKNPNLTEYELCKKLKWSCGKVYNSMRRLEEKGL